MLGALLAAQNEINLPSSGGGEIIVWLFLAAGIVGLYFVINRTRKRSYRHYMDRSRLEEERRAKDPDMKKD